MVVRKKKKVFKYRGGVTHGGGSRKKRRGSGSRGGKGRAGSGKRAGHKKNFFTPIGRHGFTSVQKVFRGKTRVLNLGDLTADKLNRWAKEGKVVKEGNTFIVDFKKIKYDKLLGTGSTSFKLKIIASSWSAQAEEKIKAAGGEILSAAL